MREEEFIVLIRILVAQNQIADALKLSERVIEKTQASGRNAATIQVSLIRALIYHAQVDMDRAFMALEPALNLAEPQGAVRVFLDEGEPMAALLEAFSRQPTVTGRRFVDSLLAGFSTSQIPAESTRIGDRIANGSELVEPLSERELEVLRLLAAGLSYREIAEELYVSINTVKAHAKNIYSKLGVHGRMQAAQRAAELTLI